MPIDYSKWDNLDAYSSDDEDEKTTAPCVTRLDAPSKITFGGRGEKNDSVFVSPQSNMATPSLPMLAPSTAETLTPDSKPRSTKIGDGVSPSWTDHGGLLEISNDGNSSKRKLYWAQDRYTVFLRVELRVGEKVQSVSVEGILPYGERFTAVGQNKPKLKCLSTASVVLLEGDLPHHVHLTEEDSDEGIIDWTVMVIDSEHRFLVITLPKAVPMQGLSIWWRRPTMSFSEVDMSVVRGSGGENAGSNGGASKEFLDAWKEAHDMFREAKKEGTEKISLT